MQGNQHNIFSMRDKMEAMKMKLRTWIQRIESNVFEMFPNYYQIIKLWIRDPYIITGIIPIYHQPTMTLCLN